ncbi:MAG: hypothetical protein JO327_09910 [Nitrososphaeraceae archaeon]|nr:hypothetical protein [Nitrososphaeraceae archaeon]MBV9668430.1 hypothetical protein [Nitrososphaeraceae archaeon]
MMLTDIAAGQIKNQIEKKAHGITHTDKASKNDDQDSGDDVTLDRRLDV